MIHFKNRRQTKYRGNAMIYIVVTFAVMCMFCGLAVDLGRAQTAKTELRRAADAAARAGAIEILQGNTDYSTSTNPSHSNSIRSIVAKVAKANLADGTPVVLNLSADIQIGTWNTSTRTFTPTTTNPNAVEVFARRNGATNQSQVPLVFTQVLGSKYRSLDVWASSIAAIVAVGTTPVVNVPATSNPWLAGTDTITPGTIEASSPMDPARNYNKTTLYNSSDSDHEWEFDINGPSGLTGSTGEPYESPPQVNITLVPGDLLTVNVPTKDPATGKANLITNDRFDSLTYNADGSSNGTMYIYQDVGATPPGGTSTYPQPGYTGTGNSKSASDATGSEHNLSNISVPINSLLGVFLTGSVGQTPEKSGQTIPPGLDFSTQAQRDYTTLEPQVQQVFFIGNGQTSTNLSQTIVVPAAATRFYLGTMDGQEWSNNQGRFGGITFTVQRIELVQ